MRSLQVFCVALVVVAGPFMLIAQTLTSAEAKAHEGESGTVCGKVVGEKTATASRGEPTFINLDAAYPNQIFTILIWGNDRKSFGGELPHVGAHLCATGKIEDYKGVPEIVVHQKSQLR